MSNDKIRCPKCRSDQIVATKKGFSTGKAVVGAIVGGILVGAAAGGVGRNKIDVTCLACGHKFKPGEQLEEKAEAIVEKHFDAGYVKPVKESEIEKMKLHKCHHCGRIATASKYCPSCGTPYNETDLYYDDLASKPKIGCLSLCIVLIIPITYLMIFL